MPRHSQHSHASENRGRMMPERDQEGHFIQANDNHRHPRPAHNQYRNDDNGYPNDHRMTSQGNRGPQHGRDHDGRFERDNNDRSHYGQNRDGAYQTSRGNWDNQYRDEGNHYGNNQDGRMARQDRARDEGRQDYGNNDRSYTNGGNQYTGQYSDRDGARRFSNEDEHYGARSSRINRHDDDRSMSSRQNYDQQDQDYDRGQKGRSMSDHEGRSRPLNSRSQAERSGSSRSLSSRSGSSQSRTSQRYAGDEDERGQRSDNEPSLRKRGRPRSSTLSQSTQAATRSPRTVKSKSVSAKKVTTRTNRQATAKTAPRAVAKTGTAARRARKAS